ncbi:MAG: threonine synthase [Geodermatophilaceae bacterium]|nr:threonine synthase [Geodermatophilaceae bacterium]
MDSYSALTRLECSRCGRTYDACVPQGLCEDCSAPLLARYDLSRITIGPSDMAHRPSNLWRYHELLPVSAPEHVVSLGEGRTPVLSLPRLGAELGLTRLLVKDEGLLPTGSFKARGAAVGVARAHELGVTGLAMPTNGNAGAAWAAYAARAGIRMVVAMPGDAPAVPRAEIVATGAELRLVDGRISDAGRLVARLVADDPSLTDVATLKEPYRIEGKKTIALELAEQLGWRMPDVIIYPTGGGVGLIGIHKALTELIELGWLSGPMPRLVCVQSTGCAPIVRAFEAGQSESEPWVNAHTIAYGITVAKALGDFLVLTALRETGGTAIAVDDADLLADLRLAGRLEGLFFCPEGAATITAARLLRESGWLGADDQTVLLNTGAGLIYSETIDVDLAVEPLRH